MILVNRLSGFDVVDGAKCHNCGEHVSKSQRSKKVGINPSYVECRPFRRI